MHENVKTNPLKTLGDQRFSVSVGLERLVV